MQSIGLDLGSKESQICVSVRGTVLSERAIATRVLKDWLAGQPPSRVIMESCAESRTVASWARAAGHETYVIPATIARQVGVGARGLKNDERDARALAHYGCAIDQPATSHLKSAEAYELHNLLGTRRMLVQQRADLVRRVKSAMRERVMPRVARFHESPEFTQKLRDVFVEHPDGLPLGLAMELEQIGLLSKQIEVLNEELERIAQQRPEVVLLMTAPGVGPVVALTFASLIDDPKRFANGRALGNYLGLTPGEATTGFKERKTSVTKAGSSTMRALLVQAAWGVWRTKAKTPLGEWVHRLAERRGKKVAIVALARRLATILWAMWRDQKSFDASKTGSMEHAQSTAIETPLPVVAPTPAKPKKPTKTTSTKRATNTSSSKTRATNTSSSKTRATKTSSSKKRATKTTVVVPKRSSSPTSSAPSSTSTTLRSSTAKATLVEATDANT